MSIKIAKIVGTANEKTWSQVHEFRPEADQPLTGERLKTHGQLMAALAFKTKKEGLEVSSFGTEIITRLQESYYSNESRSVLKKVEQTMESLKAEFFNEVELEVVMGVLLQVGDESFLYAGRRGGGQVCLKRGESVVELLSGDKEAGTVVSGKLKGDDKLVIGTSQFFKIVAEGSLRANLEQGEVNEMVEGLAGVVHGHEKNSQAAAVVVLKEAEKKPEAEGEHPPSKQEKVKRVGRILEVVNKQIKRLQPKAVRVQSRDPRKQKSAATIVVVLLVIFGVSLGLAGRKRQKTKKEAEYQAVVEEVEYKYTEAMELVELNPLRAKSLLSDSKARIEEYRGGLDEKINEELEGWLLKIEQSLGEVQREYEIEEAAEWFDFSLVKDGFKGSDWELEETSLLVWDEEKKTVVEVSLETKASKVVAGGKEIEGGLVGVAGERGFVVSSDGKTVTVIQVSDGEVVAEIGEVEWGKIVDAVGFSSNLYLLDGTSEGQIYKYLGVKSGLSSQRSYLTGESYDLSEAVSMAIDGSVWVLFSDGTIVKYVRGVKDAFVVAGLDQDFQEPIKIFTTPEVDNLYVLDRKATRVVVISKTGEYQAQYRWPGIAGVGDLVVSEDLGKIYLLTGEKVFSIELKD